ncbi:hypothetical protein [Acinetobacter sp. MB5]|uniref:hypothetical protein n=1 Tax=Acinetobacter sp. MB5 TaxID=2069438 RepID=UPI000DD0ACE0|nr:hypothetical protein [Acinetobacter sp. MB5]
MVHNKFKCSIILISLGLIACKYSNPYRSGEIKFITKNNTPCLYIDEQDFTGEYAVSIGQYEVTEPTFDYRSSFKENFPRKDNCLMINNQNFKNLNLKMNTPYDLFFEMAAPDQNSVFRKNIFCIRSDRGKKIIQRFDGVKCSDIPVEKTTK